MKNIIVELPGLARQAISEAVETAHSPRPRQPLPKPADIAAAFGGVDELEALAERGEGAEAGAILARSGAVAAQGLAETARDAAFVNADVYADTSAGLAGTSVSEQFQVVAGDEVIRYLHEAGPVATEVARYPSAPAVPARAGRKSAAAQYLSRVPAVSLFRDAPQAVGLLERLADAGLFDDLAVALPAGGAYLLNDGVERAYSGAVGNFDATQGDSANRPDLDASGGMVFNGTSDFLSISRLAIDEDAFSISLTFRADSYPETLHVMVARGNPQGTSLYGWALLISNQHRVRFQYRNAANALFSTPWVTVRLGAEYTVTLVYEGGVGARMYLNGSLAAVLETTDVIKPASTARDIQIGAASGLTNRYDGLIRDVLIWDRALTDQECRDLPAVLRLDADVPVPMQPLDFHLDGVLDTSRSPLWLPASARPALRPLGGAPVFDANGVFLDDGRALDYNLPRGLQTFGVGFTFYPDWDFGTATAPVSTPRFIELISPTIGTPDQSPRAYVRFNSAAIYINFEGYSPNPFAFYGRLGWKAGDRVECYILSEPGNLSLFIKNYRAAEGVKVDVISVVPPADFLAQRIVCGSPAVGLTAKSSYSRVRIDIPPYQMPDPNSYFGRPFRTSRCL
jgi:hypothetical protein